MKAPSAPTLPKCADCRGGDARVVTRGDFPPGVAHEWLCASCEYKRSHPDAAPSVPRAARAPAEGVAERAAIR